MSWTALLDIGMKSSLKTSLAEFVFSKVLSFETELYLNSALKQVSKSQYTTQDI